LEALIDNFKIFLIVMLLYLHIPFCHKICPYCSFYKHKPSAQAQMLAFVDALLIEFDHRVEQHGLNIADFETLYFGGGTPSLLSAKAIKTLMEGFAERLDFAQLDEISIETNPRTFDQAKAQLFADLGFGRASLGIQSFHAKELAFLGRDHSTDEAKQAAGYLQSAGLKTNLDLMFGLPNQSLASWESSLEQVAMLNSTSLSCYHLTYEQNTPFYEPREKGLLRSNEILDEGFFTMADKYLTSLGYDHYETSNYAKSGCESIHNRGYWEGRDYLGLGPSAVSTINEGDGFVRYENVSSTDIYIAQAELREFNPTKEILTQKDWEIERIALMLRTNTGIAKKHLGQVKEQAIQDIINQGYAYWRPDKQELESLTLKGKGKLLVDGIVEHLIST